MHYRTRKKVKDGAAVGVLAVPVAALVRMAANSDHALRRAGKTSATIAAVGGVVGGSLGFLSYKGKNATVWDDQALESTLALGALGGVLAGIGAGLASLSRSAMKRK